MNSFVETVSPAAKDHIASRIAYFNEVALAVVSSTRDLAEANLQFSRDWLSASTDIWQATLLKPSAERSTAAIPSAESVTERFQSYQQRLAQISTDLQTALNEVAKHHVPQTTRTAHALADVVTQKANAEADQQLRINETAGKDILDQASQFARAATQNRAHQEPASMQSANYEGNKS